MTRQDERTETTTRPWWVRALLATGLAGAMALNGGAPIAAIPSR